MIYLVYKTDVWHSYASRDIIGVCTTLAHAYDAIRQQARKEGEKLTEEDIFNLVNIKQTQGYTGDGEFQIEGIEKNKLL